MRRVSVVGNSGSGKTTLARSLAAALGAPHLELDAVFHQPGWQPRPAEEFRAAVQAFTSGPSWVVDGNYQAVQDIVWSRADTVVWLDLPHARVMRRVVARTLRRTLLRVELWNGNRERWRDAVSRDPERSIVAWAWTQRHTYRERYTAAQHDPANAHLHFIVVANSADVERLLARARSSAAAGDETR